MYMYWQWQIYQIWGLAASGSRSRNLKRSYPACPKNKKNPPPSILYYNIHLHTSISVLLLLYISY